MFRIQSLFNAWNLISMVCTSDRCTRTHDYLEISNVERHGIYRWAKWRLYESHNNSRQSYIDVSCIEVRVLASCIGTRRCHDWSASNYPFEGYSIINFLKKKRKKAHFHFAIRENCSKFSRKKLSINASFRGERTKFQQRSNLVQPQRDDFSSFFSRRSSREKE